MAGKIGKSKPIISEVKIEAETELIQDFSTPVSKKPILEEWFIFFKLLRVFGNCPLSVYPSSEIPFKFQPCSVISFFSGACFLSRLSIVTLHFTTDWSLSLIGPGAETEIQDWIMEMTNFLSVPLLHIWELCCTWITLKKLIALFNNWSRFETEYSKVFVDCEHQPLQYRTFLKPFRQASCAFSLVLILSISTVSSFYFQDGGFKSVGLDWNLLTFLVKVTMITTSFLEEVKVMMMYLSLSEAFSNIHRGIKLQLKKSETSLEMVVEWKRLIGMVREQVKLTGEVQSAHQLAALFHAVVLYTETLFLLVKGAVLTKGPINMAIMFGIMSISHFMRFLVKTVLAQRITEKEMKIAEEISAISPINLSLNINMELSKLGHIMRQTPSKISLSGFVTIEKRLVLKMSSYIVGYLVVLVQFHLTDRGRRN